MRLLCSAILLFITLVSVNKPGAASEIDERKEIEQVVVKALAFERFSEVTDLADRYRVEKTRTESGVWKLTLLYFAIKTGIEQETSGRPVEPAFRLMKEKMQRWTKQQPNSAVARLAYANVLLKHAFAIRGGGYAATVRQDAWPRFHALIEEMRLYLDQAKPIAGVDPDWYQMMLTVARLQSWDAKRFGATFDGAVAQEPLFYQNYFTAVDYFLPKWNGNVKDVELFAQFAAGKTAATEGTSMYARIYWYASQVGFGDEIFQESLANWPKMKAGFDDMLARYPDSWNYNTYGKFACLARDKKATRAFFDKIDGQPLYEAWTPGLLKACSTWAMSGSI